MTWRDGSFMLLGALLVVAVSFGVVAWLDRLDRHDGMV